MSKLPLMELEESTVSKRQLGIALTVIGAIAVVAVLSIDVLDAGRDGGIGPLQSLALALALITALVGLTLLPLGDAPA